MSGLGVSSSELKSIWLFLDSGFCTDIQLTFRKKFIREEAEARISFSINSSLMRAEKNMQSTLRFVELG